MTVLVIGEPDSGKSACAEELALQTEGRKRYYLATMKVMDEAGEKRVIAHRDKRAGKGFVTIECQREIGAVTEQMEAPKEAVLLLECVSNLVANTMHDDPRWSRLTKPVETDEDLCRAFADSVAEEILKLSERVHDLIIVTNDYEKDDPGYDAGTKLYIRLLDLVNERVAKFSDRVVDVRKRK
ncbi:MAG: bifunctional adenosylcobinamide kinase/adenosylcobinamide-phosphate guanylyltransferase [Lachnospiraceae bacterium]|nr:bifunctional adenosylcobinamide kinase/adenosylcobinamide-phosphate guanylyltransferase [Lachnospiraceae bacterium]